MIKIWRTSPRTNWTRPNIRLMRFWECKMTTQTPSDYGHRSEGGGRISKNLESGRGKTSSAIFLALFIALLPGVASPLSPDPEPHPNAALATSDRETSQETEDKRLTVPGLEEMLG